MATGTKEIPGGWGIGHLPFPDAETPIRRYADIFLLVTVLVLAAPLLLSGCAESDNGKKGDPVFFGGAGGGNGGGGATSGVSVSW